MKTSKSMVKAAAIQQLSAKVALIVTKANSLFNINLDPSVDFNQRGGRIAGMATYYPMTRSFKLSFNVGIMILSESNWCAMLDNTIAHEVAHLVEFAIRGKSDHGSEFSQICIALGGNGNAKHSMTTNKAGGNYVYHTDRGDVTLSAIQHKKVCDNKTSYTSKRHGGRAVNGVQFTHVVHDSIDFIPRSETIVVAPKQVAAVVIPQPKKIEQIALKPAENTMLKRISNPVFYVLLNTEFNKLVVELDGKVVYTGCMMYAISQGEIRGKFAVIDANDLF